MKYFAFLILLLICLPQSFAQVREERDNVFEDNKETSQQLDERVTLSDDSDSKSPSDKIVEEITEEISWSVKKCDIRNYLNCLSKEKREKDKVKIAKRFMMQNNQSNLDVLNTFVLSESDDQIDFMAKYCVDGNSIILSEVTLIKEEGRFVISKEKILESEPNSSLASLGIPERNAHLKGLDPNDPNVVIKPCHMGANCRHANAAGHKLAAQEKQQQPAKPFEPMKDLNPILDPPFNQNVNLNGNRFVDQNGGIREVNDNGWVSVPKNGPQYVDLKQLGKFFPDRYTGCKDGNCFRNPNR